MFEKQTEKKKLLDKYRPLPLEVLKNLDEWFRVELTYTSNAIEDNTLSRREVERIFKGGKSVLSKNQGDAGENHD